MPHRAGSLMPALVMAIAVSGAALALVANQLWVNTAYEELRTTAHAAALVGAQTLITDDLLRDERDDAARAREVRTRVEAMVAADPVAIRLQRRKKEPQVEVRLGRVVVNRDSGWTDTLETDHDPTSVLIALHQDRRHRNAVELFLPYLTGVPTADVTAVAEASITNHIRGVRPLPQSTIRALPLAIADFSPDPRVLNWTVAIEGPVGVDALNWNEEERAALPGPDGLPELLCQSKPENFPGNIVLVDLGTGFQDDALRRQIEHGWSYEDLEEFDHELVLDDPLTLDATDDLTNIVAALEAQIGQPRIVLLYSSLGPPGSSGNQSAQISRLAAARLLEVTEVDGNVMIVLQASVIGSRMALLDEDAWLRNDESGNRYIYKLSVTQ